MDWKQFFGLHSFEILYLVVLAFLPWVVAQRVVGTIVLFLAAIVGARALWRKYTRTNIVVSGQGVLVTGCDTGFGHALAHRLDSAGFTVFAGCLNSDGDGATELKDRNSDRLHVLSLDVTKDRDIKNAFDYVQQTSGDAGLWCIINNAAINFTGDIEFCTMEMFRRVADVNMFGMIHMTKTFLPMIRKSKGRVVNVTSTKGKLSMPSNACYNVTKFGIETFSDILRLEMRKFGVTVVIVEPGNFGGSTGMLSKKTLDWLRKEYDKMWEEASEDVKTTYGQEYLESLYQDTVGSAASACKTIAPVVEAMEDAVISKSPKIRYLVDGSNKPIDMNNLFLHIQPYVPESVMDYILDKMYNMPLPKVAKKE